MTFHLGQPIRYSVLKEHAGIHAGGGRHLAGLVTQVNPDDTAHIVVFPPHGQPVLVHDVPYGGEHGQCHAADAPIDLPEEPQPEAEQAE